MTSDTRPSTLARPLDVEVLTRVFAVHHGPSFFPGLQDVTILGPTPRHVAEQIAAEYSRLLEERPKVAPESESEKREAFGR